MKLKQSLRSLTKTPSVTVIATLSLALGIGATSGMFSLFNQLILRSLPVQDPARLVNLSAPGPKPGSTSCNVAGTCEDVFSYAMFRDLERIQTVFPGIAAHCQFGANLSYRRQTMTGEGMLVSGSYFSVLGVRPALGRLLGTEDDRSIGQSPVVVLSHEFWRSRFNQSPSVLNDTIIINGQSMTIVGVAQADFSGTTVGSSPLVFVPITLRGLMQPGWNGFENRLSYWAYLFARLKPGVSLDQARVAMNAAYRPIVNEVEAPLQPNLSAATMARFRNKPLLLEAGNRGQSDLHLEAQAPLLIMLCVTGLVLLIACANVANLLLARAATRTGEMAVRLSVGASRYQLVRQLLGEAVLLATLGGLFGLVVARWTLDFIASLLPAEVVLKINFVVDVPVMLFAAALTIGTGVMFGLFPALHSTRRDLLTVLKSQSGQPSGARAAARFRNSLATAQIALSMTLLVAAGLFTKSLFNVSRVDLGLKPENVITFGVSPERNGYKTEQSRAFFERLDAELAATPGVTSVSSGVVQILAGNNWGANVSVQGFDAGPDTDTHSNYNQIGPGFFKLLGIPLITGREFTPEDRLGSPKVAIVNERFADKFNLGRTAVGKRMRVGSGGELDLEIVGLVQDAKYSQVKDAVPPQFFLPYRQNNRVGFLNYYVHTSGDPEALLATLPRLISRLDPNLPLENLRTLPQQIRENVFEDRAMSIFCAAFALLATVLAATGLYGVLSYTVAQRTREFGVRMVLGAEPWGLRGMILRHVGWMTLVGGAVGLAAAVALFWLAQSMLYEIQSYDPTVIVSAAVLLSLVALAAGFFPARRASKIDPMRALRYE